MKKREFNNTVTYLDERHFVKCADRDTKMVIKDLDGRKIIIWINFAKFVELTELIGSTPPIEDNPDVFSFNHWLYMALPQSCPRKPPKKKVSETERLIKMAARLGHHVDIGNIMASVARHH